MTLSRRGTLSGSHILPWECVDCHPGKRRISLAGAKEMKHGLFCGRERHKQLAWPKLLALTSEFNIDRRLRQLRSRGYKVTLRAQFHAVCFIPEVRIPAKRQNRILAFAVRSGFRVRRNDQSFPGWPVLHGAKHSGHSVGRKPQRPLSCDLRVLELQHGSQCRCFGATGRGVVRRARTTFADARCWRPVRTNTGLGGICRVPGNGILRTMVAIRLRGISAQLVVESSLGYMTRYPGLCT